jgi:hypothetical protein
MKTGLLLSGMLALLVSVDAGAQRVPPFTIAPEPACQRAIGRNALNLFHTLLKGWEACYAAEGLGRGDCTSLDTAKNEKLFRKRVDFSCGHLGTFDKLGLGPSPAQALDVLIPTLAHKVEDLAGLLYAAYAGGERRLASSDPTLYGCLVVVGQETEKLADAQAAGDAMRCIDLDDAQQVAHPGQPPACNEASRVAKIQAQASKAQKRIAAQCRGLVDAAALVQATAAAADYAVCRSYPKARNRNVCPPPTIFLKTLGGRIDIGWRGVAHNSVVSESLPMPIELSSCVGDAQTTCDLYAAVNGVVRSVTPSVSPDGTAVCLVRKHTGDLTGSMTFTGDPSHLDAATLNTPTSFDLHLPVTLQIPCPTCSGAALGDAGTCEGGANGGQPCVVDGTYGPLGNTSATCRPIPGSRIIGMNPQMDGTSTDEHRLTAAYPCAFGGGLCHCPHQQYANQCYNEESPTCEPDATCAFDGNPCFPDTIVRTGSASPFVVAGIGCIPATGAAAINVIIGLPGPMAVTVEYEIVGAP